MQYAMLIHAEPGYTDTLSEDEQKPTFAEYVALGEDPRHRAGAQLQPVETATTVRVQEGQTLTTDGPFADTNGVLVGYYRFEADDLDEAIEMAARIPAARLGGDSTVPPKGVFRNDAARSGRRGFLV